MIAPRGGGNLRLVPGATSCCQGLVSRGAGLGPASSGTCQAFRSWREVVYGAAAQEHGGCHAGKPSPCVPAPPLQPALAPHSEAPSPGAVRASPPPPRPPSSPPSPPAPCTSRAVSAAFWSRGHLGGAWSPALASSQTHGLPQRRAAGGCFCSSPLLWQPRGSLATQPF